MYIESLIHKRLMVSRLGWGQNGERLLMGMGILLGDDENVLNLNQVMFAQLYEYTKKLASYTQ